MNKIITAALFGAFLTGCVAHAHAPVPHHSAHVEVKVKAWVWAPGHYRATGAWVHGSWNLVNIERQMLNRYPRTHVRWVKGRKKPAPRRHSHRRHRRQHRR